MLTPNQLNSANQLSFITSTQTHFIHLKKSDTPNVLLSRLRPLIEAVIDDDDETMSEESLNENFILHKTRKTKNEELRVETGCDLLHMKEDSNQTESCCRKRDRPDTIEVGDNDTCS